MERNKSLYMLFFLLFVSSIYCQQEKISLLFTGDFMGHKDQIDAAYNQKTQTYNYTEVFKYIDSTLKKPDISIGNLEVTLGSKPYTGYPRFSSPIAYARDIKNAGIDVLMTANNHSCDMFSKGIIKTVTALDSLQIKHAGTYVSIANKTSNYPLIIRKKGFTIALLNYTYGTNGIKPTLPNTVNYLNEELIKSDIKKAKLSNPDILIAYVHWGLQYKNQPSKSQKKWTQFLNENGVKIVVGAHPHVVQPIKFNKENDSFVAYSLGNFVSHQRTFPRDGGIVLKLDFVKSTSTSKTVLGKASYKLTWVYEPIEKGRKRYYILPVVDFEKKPGFFSKEKDYAKMIRYAKHARKLFSTYNINVNEYK